MEQIHHVQSETASVPEKDKPATDNKLSWQEQKKLAAERKKLENQYQKIEEQIEQLEDRVKRQLAEFFTQENYENSHREFAEVNREREYEYEHLLIYFTCRYFMRAFYDDNLLTKAQFAIAGFLMIRDMDVVRYFAKGKQFSLEDRIDTVRIYAKEVEHSEENIDCLGEDFLFEEVFLVEELEKQILCTEMPRM